MDPTSEKVIGFRMQVAIRFFVVVGYVALWLIPVPVARAQMGSGDSESPSGLECSTCHSVVHDTWERSEHNKGLECTQCHHQVFGDRLAAGMGDHGAEDDPANCMLCHTTNYDLATNTWQADGIHCPACHNPVPANHPEAPMPADRSADLCGKCHREAVFEWQVSAHRQAGLSCVSCHSQHATALKSPDAAALCANCHRDRALNYAHTTHYQEGLSCDGCHLGSVDQPPGAGHAKRDHSFQVSLSTCNACHAYQMHAPAVVHPEGARLGPSDSSPPMAPPSQRTRASSVVPESFGHIGYAAISWLIGLGAGLVAAPWLRRGSR